MTRFARAKGSKASNERVPEDATSWREMKDQLLHKETENTSYTSRSECGNERYDNEEASTEWASFHDDTQEIKPVKRKHRSHDVHEEGNQKKKKSENILKLEQTHFKTKKNVGKNMKDREVRGREIFALSPEGEKTEGEPHIKIKKNKKQSSMDINNSSPVREESPNKVERKIYKTNTSEAKQEKGPKIFRTLVSESPDKGINSSTNQITSSRKKKKKVKSNHVLEEDESAFNMEEDVQESHFTFKEKKHLKVNLNIEKHNKSKPKNKSDVNLKHKQNSKVAIHEIDIKNEDVDNMKEMDMKHKTKLFKNNERQKNKISKSYESNKTKYLSDVKSKKGVRKKPENQPKVVNINGQEFCIVPFDGFYIKEEDALRLEELKRDMIKKGIPMKEVQGAIKLERRRAEKALSRARKRVCFHCRKFGHNLSSCPEIEDRSDTATGICYKCGSTEHTYFQCKVTHNEDFRFAECFICKEQGHIARQCPDNPRGLYPKGGACKLCGDVTHLKKDCPTFIAEKEEQALTIEISNKSNIEGLEEDSSAKINKSKNKMKKIIKF